MQRFNIRRTLHNYLRSSHKRGFGISIGYEGRVASCDINFIQTSVKILLILHNMLLGMNTQAIRLHRLINCIGLCRRYINITNTILGIIHRPVF